MISQTYNKLVRLLRNFIFSLCLLPLLGEAYRCFTKLSYRIYYVKDIVYEIGFLYIFYELKYQMTSKIIVTVNEGKIRGIKNKSMFSGTEFFSFYGVPYGQPTGKTARFKDPTPVKPWKNIYDATEQKDGCAQSSMRMKRITGSEDCLYNNIHTPKLPSSKDPLKAVIVNIHPGGFLAGSPETNYYGSPEYIMQNDIVYISIGYRLHFLGFLNLGVEECSGNQALKDIVLGLKWIKNNIAAFGGDPENVTLIGSSTGAIMINSLMLSPRAKGLFHKAILMGGFLFFTICPIFEENQWLAIKYAQAYGYEKASASEKEKLLSYYKRMHLSDLVPTYAKEDVAYKLPPAALPCSSFNITLDTAGEEPIFPVSPRKLVDSIARIPVMFGVCEKEAIMGFTRGMKEKVMKNFKTSFCRNSWSWAHHMTDEEVEAMFEEIKSFYLNGKDINDAPIPILSDIQSDGAYSEIYEAIIDVISAELPSSAYVYEFQFESTNEINTLKDLILPLYDQPIEGAYHACDYSYWACTIYEWEMQKIKTMSNRTRKMITTFTKLLTTFAKTGDPNYEGLEVEWKPSTPEEPCHLTINDSLKLVDGKINDKRMRFWDSLRKKYGKQ